MKTRPLEFDPDRARIAFYHDAATGRYVKVVTDKEACGSDSETIAAERWVAKFGEPMPSVEAGTVELMDPETSAANFIPYDGTIALSDEERAHIDAIVDGGSDLNFEMLYFAIEGLGWRPLCSPSDNDAGWKDVFAREREGMFFADIIADLVFPSGVDIKETLARIAHVHAPDLADEWAPEARPEAT